ncbi:MAG: mercuric reductase [Acidobacteriota bacterium]
MTDPWLAPDDEHNRRLAGNVRPSDWTNPRPARRYNLAVIGAGTAGLVTAAAAAGLGARVALVEQGLMGGDCLNFGCVPSKALIRSARAAASIGEAGAFGIRVAGEAKVDFTAVMQRLRRLRSDLSVHDSAHRFRELGVDVFFGQARFRGRTSLIVGDHRIRFKKAVIATGSRPVVPPIPGLAAGEFLTNENVFSLSSLPTRLAVIGGGPIGCELAQAFARLGSRVTILERSPQLLPREDPDVADLLARVFQEEGIRLHLGATVDRIEHGDGTHIVHWTQASTAGSSEVDQILVATGRQPNIEDLGLATVGVRADRSGVQVNRRLQTTNSRIYAAGDVCFPYRFTHAADATARLVVENALFFGNRSSDALNIPWCTYTSPEVAHVGLSESEAAKRGLKIGVFRVGLDAVDRAVLDGRTAGFVKILVRKGSDQLVGATIVAENAGDMIGELTLAMDAGLGLKNLSTLIHPYPTQAEAIRKAADAFQRARLTPFVRRLLGLWFRLVR